MGPKRHPFYKLPPSPSAAELRTAIGLGLLGAFTVDRTVARVALHGRIPHRCRGFSGSALDPALIRMRFRELHWETTFRMLAIVSAGLSHHGILGKFQIEVMQRMVQTRRLHPGHVVVAERIAPHIGKSPLFHERLMYVMFQLAAEECVTTGRAQWYDELAFLGLLLNDHLENGNADAAAEPEAFASSIALALRYNHSRDHLREMGRIYDILLRPPPEHCDLGKTPTLWDEIQRGACGGRSLSDYIGLFLHPLMLFAQTRWGDTEAPCLEVGRWYQNSPELVPVVLAWLEPLTTTVDELRAAKQAAIIPVAPLTLLRKPFVRFGHQYWAATPWAVQRQLHTGVRFRLLQSAKQLGKPHEDAWSYGFGHMTEAYTQRLALSAASTKAFRGRIEIADTPGTGEIDDVIWTDGTVAIVFSVKSTLIAEADAFNVSSVAGVTNGLEKLLFAPKRKGYRIGAARQLDENVQRVRAGSTSLPKDVVVFPVLVMYDEPLENVAITNWMAERLHHHGLLAQVGVRSLTLCNLDDFESIMFLASKGRDLGVLFEQKQQSPWKTVRLDVFLRSTSGFDAFRPPTPVEAFERVSRRSFELLREEAHIPED